MGAMTSYVALLRAVNVAGHGSVAMADLRALLTGLGFGEARSLLNSGNLVFATRKMPTAALEIHSTQVLHDQLLSFYVSKSLAVCGAALSEVVFPAHSAAVLIVRADELIAPRGQTVLQAGDHVYVFCRPEDRPYIELLFGRPVESEVAE